MSLSPLSRFVAALLLAALPAGALAQPIALDPEAPPPTLIPFQPEEGLGEWVGRAEGVVDADGARFYLDGLDVMSPLIVRVFAEDPQKPIDVALHRFFWKDANLVGRTNDEGDWGYAGRIHDEVGIQLRADQPSGFYVLAWRGPAEKPVAPAQLFVPPGGEAPGGGGSGRWLWIGIGVLLLLAGITLGTRMRRPAAAAALLAILGGSTDVAADEMAARITAAETRLTELTRQIETLRSRQAQDYEDISALARHAESVNDALWKARGEVTGLRFALEELSLDTAAQIASLQASIEGLELLAEEDAEAIPEPPGGLPPMVSQCSSDPGCLACFQSADAKLRELMGYYSQLDAIYSSADAYVTAMIGYGDAKSGWHQLEQAAWYDVKQQIVAAHAETTAAYRAKKREFDERMLSTLQEYGACEQEHGLPDWYTRYGQPFYYAMTSAYELR